MKRETIDQLCGEFERLVHVEQETGLEFWLARELQGVLGYDKWENFSKVVDKARLACKNAGFEPQDHFLEARKMIGLGKGGPARDRRLHADALRLLSDRTEWRSV